MSDYKKEIECASSALKGEAPIFASTEEKALALDRAIMALNHLVRKNVAAGELIDRIINGLSPEENHSFLAERERCRSMTRAYAHVRNMLVCFQKFASEGIDTEKRADVVSELRSMIAEAEKDTEELTMTLDWYRSAFLPCELPAGNKKS